MPTMFQSHTECWTSSSARFTPHRTESEVPLLPTLVLPAAGVPAAAPPPMRPPEGLPPSLNPNVIDEPTKSWLSTTPLPQSFSPLFSCSCASPAEFLPHVLKPPTNGLGVFLYTRLYPFGVSAFSFHTRIPLDAAQKVALKIPCLRTSRFLPSAPGGWVRDLRFRARRRVTWAHGSLDRA